MADLRDSMTRLDDVLSHWAEYQPRHKAFTELDDTGAEVGSVSYAQLATRARALAKELSSSIEPGRHAILAYPPGIDFIVAFFACMYAGIAAAPMPLPKRNRSNARLAKMVASADAVALLSTSETLDWMTSVLTREADWPAKVRLVASDLAASADQSGISLDRVSNTHAFTQFTSGSTSLPKGVMISHEACVYNLKMIRAISGAGPDWVSVSWLPHYHDLGLVAHLLHNVFAGGHCVTLPPVTFITQPVQWLRAITRYHGQYTGAPNFAYQLCVDRIEESDLAALDLSSLRMVINAAEPINPRTLRAFCERFEPCGFEPRMFLPAYGMAEATVCISAGELHEDPVITSIDAQSLYSDSIAAPARDGAAAKELVGCGRGKLLEKITIVDPSTRRPLPPNHIGEIWVSGPHLMTGYYRNPEATAEVLTEIVGNRGLHLRTGDLGFVDPAGELYITGRMKDMIIVNGANYYPQDIEVCVEGSHPSLRRGCSAAIGISSEGSERLVVFAEVTKDTAQRSQKDPDVLSDIAEQICGAVSEQFELSVSNIVFLKPTQLPKTSSGKVRRQECKQRFLNQDPERLATWPFAAGSNQRKHQMHNIEKSIQRVIDMGPEHLRVFSTLTQILTSQYNVRMAEFDIDKSIFFYGIDSLSMIDIHNHMEKTLQRSIPTVALFHANSILEMIDDIVLGMNDRGSFDRRLAEGQTLREDVDQYVAYFTEKVAKLEPNPDGRIGASTLLTGASGFLGVALLKELLERTDARVLCLVRAADEATALKRVQKTSAKFALTLPEHWERRVTMLVGDMSKPRLGLSAEDYERHAQQVDSVVHCAALDNFYLPYSVMRKTNVLGAVEVFDFAIHRKMKPVFYISSCAVSMLEAKENAEVMGLVNGYAQSKYVVEQIVQKLAAAGYPWVTYRLGYLYNLRLQDVPENLSFEGLLERVEAAYQQLDEHIIVDTDAFENFLSSIAKIGACPAMDADFDLTPVEYAAKAIVATTLQRPAERKSLYTFYNPTPLRWQDVMNYFEQNHPEIELVPLPVFLERYEAYVRATDRASVKLLKSVVSPVLANQFNTMFRQVPNDLAAQFKAWCPPCEPRFTHAYVDFAVNA